MCFIVFFTKIHNINNRIIFLYCTFYICNVNKMKRKKKIITKEWDRVLHECFQKNYFKKLMIFVSNEREIKNVFPVDKDIFNAFKKTSFLDCKVVILGQDPYHKKNQANGLAFSVNQNIKIPPSLRNIFKELKSDLGIDNLNSGNLEKWSNQGVLLLNTTLTVRENEAGSHKDLGWDDFTDTVITKLSNKKEQVIFLLWGNFAQRKSTLIDQKKNIILTAPHPSPLSAYKGFFGCKHFSKTNKLLIQNKQEPISWQI